MHTFALTCLVLSLFSASFASPVLTSHTISSSLYDDFVRYAQYSSAAYQLRCPSPLSTTLVQSFSGDVTQGFISRDTQRKEIVVSFRGTFSLADIAADLDLRLVPFVSPGLNQSFTVHEGHSLGGALAALGGVSIKTALPKAVVKVYTFGQPRTGDAKWAAFAESTIGSSNIFRAVHTFGKHSHEIKFTSGLTSLCADGVPTIISRVLGYEHHSTEYWQFEDPILLTSPPTTVKQCSGKEDPTCSDSILSTGINIAHPFYFGQLMGFDPLCA
ncbi:alpha/beta-hydrolase [Mycena sanguinolenta]|nr:alpha/beta-hydrolase [Mycena sanguinolenta]